MSAMMITGNRPREPRGISDEETRENRSAHTNGAKPKVPATQAERLTQARTRAGYETREAAARALKEPVSSYHLREQGRRDLTPAVAERYAKFFRVTPEWLLYGRTGTQMIPIRGAVGPEGIVLKERAKLPTVEAPPSDIDARLVPYIIRSRALMPMCHDGDVIYYDETTFNAPIDRELVSGRKCMVQSTTGSLQVAIVIDISRDNKATLHLPDGRYRPGVTLRRAAPILWTRHDPTVSIVC